jgi:acyl carrier protein
MVPSSFVMLRAMPFTPIGKLDYGALPAPTSLRPQLEAAYVAPKIEIEKRIATVWQEVLGIEQVGLQDNFFDLGGQSVLLAQIHSKLQDIFQQDIPMVDMFKHTTINALAQYLGAKKNESATKDPLESLDVSKSRLKQLSERRQRTGENQ